MHDIDRVAFTFTFNWEVIVFLVCLVAGIVGYMMLKDGKYDRELFTIKTRKFTLAMAAIPAGVVLGILVGLIVWAAGATWYWFRVDIYWYAVMIVLGMVVAIVAGIFLAKKKGYSADLIIDIALVCIPLGIIGARLWFIIFPYADDPHHFESFWDMINLRDGGLGIYGGVIGGTIGVILVALWKKINIFRMLDLAAPCVLIAQAFGRWGNFFNQEAYGFLVENPAWQWFPFATYIFHPSVAGDVAGWHLATFFYESMWNLAGFAAIYWFAYKKNKIDGLITCLYFFWYGLGRAWIESLRTDQLMIGSFPVSILFSIIMITAAVAAGAYFIWNYYRKKKAAPPDGDKPDGSAGGDPGGEDGGAPAENER